LSEERKEGIECFRYSAHGEDNVISEICILLDGEKGGKEI